MTLRELAEKTDHELKGNPVKPPKKSAADIEALRWRELFQAALTGLSYDARGRNHDQDMVQRAAAIADRALIEFHARYRAEGT